MRVNLWTQLLSPNALKIQLGDFFIQFLLDIGNYLKIPLRLMSKYDQVLDSHFNSLRAEISHSGLEVLWFGTFVPCIEPSKGLLFREGSRLPHKVLTKYDRGDGPKLTKTRSFPRNLII